MKRLIVTFLLIILVLFTSDCSNSILEQIKMTEIKMAFCYYGCYPIGTKFEVDSTGKAVKSIGTSFDVDKFDTPDFMTPNSTQSIRLTRSQMKELENILDKVDTFKGEYDDDIMDISYFLIEVNGNTFCYSPGGEKDKDLTTYIDSLNSFIIHDSKWQR